MRHIAFFILQCLFCNVIKNYKEQIQKLKNKWNIPTDEKTG